jgi:hypothetical protein
MKKIIAVIAITLATGCAGMFQVPPAEMYGEAPDPFMAEMMIEDAVKNKLKDPDSAKFKNITGPYKAYGNIGAAYGGDIKFAGWVYYVDVNARNSFGGYSGHKKWIVGIQGGRTDAEPVDSEMAMYGSRFGTVNFTIIN